MPYDVQRLRSRVATNYITPFPGVLVTQSVLQSFQLRRQQQQQQRLGVFLRTLEVFEFEGGLMILFSPWTDARNSLEVRFAKRN